MAGTVEDIKERLGISELVSSYIRLTRAGANLKARCPFHTEKTPSFYVSPERNAYYCFGCNRGGDIFTFVQEIEGVSFYEALKELAERTGVRITREDPEARSRRARLSEAVRAAARYYVRRLAREADVLEYLKGRGLSPEAIRDFKLGFAPEGWRNIADELTGAGFTEEEIVEAGLALRRQGPEGGIYDRFRRRIMFPLSDPGGRIVGFSGRIFGTDREEAKYINTPETPLYKKSRILYGYCEAKGALRETGEAVVAEGQMDVILSHQAGVRNAVALSGTALTDPQVDLLSRFADSVTFALDSDEAGIKALIRSSERALSRGLSAYAVSLDGEKDPADLVARDPGAWKQALGARAPVVRYLLDRAAQHSSSDREFSKAVRAQVLPLIRSTDDKIEQAQSAREAARALGVPEDAVLLEAEKLAAAPGERGQGRARAARPGAAGTKKSMIARQIAGIALWQADEDDAAVDPEAVLARLGECIGSESPLLDRLSAPARLRLSFEAEQAYRGAENIARVVEELFNNYKEELIRERFADALSRLREAERQGRDEEVSDLVGTCNELSSQLRNIKGRNISI